MSTTPETLVGLHDSTLALPATTDVANSLTEVGSDFGTLLLGVGNAVATTQQKLTENSAETTKALANTLVDVVAVQQTVYDDDGTIRASVPIKEKMPVITFVSPVYYEYPKVRLQARFMMSEFVASGSASTSSSSSGYGFGLGISLQKKAFGLAASGGHSSGSQSTSISAQSDQATAVGQMRMFARLQDRQDIGIPKPLRVIVGPSITIVAADLQENTDTDGTLTRTLSVLIQLRKRNGDPIDGKALSIETEGIPWSFVPDDDANVTNADGNLEIQLKRTFPKPPEGAPPVDTTPKPAIITAILGMVSNRTTVTM